MNLKKLVMIGIVLLSMSLSLANLSADVCNVQSSCNPENTILKLSSATNAHGELYDQPTYNYFLCCDFTTEGLDAHISRNGGANKIVGLSSITNAHVQTPEQITYETNVYFGDLMCVTENGGCSAMYPVHVLSLSDTTNAHIGGFDDFETKICCTQSTFCGDNIIQTPNSYGFNEVCDDGENNGAYSITGYCNLECTEIGPHLGDGIINGPEICDDGNTLDGDGCSSQGQLETEAYWANEKWEKIGNDVGIEAHIGETIKIIINNTGSLTTDVFFEIYEIDLVFDDKIRVGADALVGIFNDVGYGNVVAEWTITQEDYEKTEQGDYDKFIFRAIGEESNQLTILLGDNTIWCSNYEEEESCNDCDYAGCNAAQNSVNSKVFEAFPEIWGDIRCGDKLEGDDSECSYFMSCKCVWDAENTPSCGYDWGSSPASDCDPKYPEIGFCTYQENAIDTCDDGFLEYSWIATWKWGIDNGYMVFTEGPSLIEGDYVLYNGKYYYDPQKISEECVGGNNVIPCPAQIKIPFFGISNLIVAIILIIVAYSLFILKDKKKFRIKKLFKKIKKQFGLK